LESLGTAIDQKSCHSFLTFGRVVDLVDHGIDPASSFHVVKSCNDDLELAEILFIKLLDWICVSIDRDTLDTILYKFGCHMGLVLADILASEEELAVQVRQINLIQVNYVNAFEAREG
jgi:hypothetical protein